MSRLATLSLLVILGLSLRLYTIAATPVGMDITNFEATGQIVAGGGNIYTEQYFYNYSPLPSLVSAVLARLPVSFDLSFRCLVLVADLTNAALVYAILKRIRPRAALWGFILVWLSPFLILFGAFDASFDTGASSAVPAARNGYLYVGLWDDLGVQAIQVRAAGGETDFPWKADSDMTGYIGSFMSGDLIGVASYQPRLGVSIGPMMMI